MAHLAEFNNAPPPPPPGTNHYRVQIYLFLVISIFSAPLQRVASSSQYSWRRPRSRSQRELCHPLPIKQLKARLGKQQKPTKWAIPDAIMLLNRWNLDSLHLRIWSYKNSIPCSASWKGTFYNPDSKCQDANNILRQVSQGAYDEASEYPSWVRFHEHPGYDTGTREALLLKKIGFFPFKRVAAATDGGGSFGCAHFFVTTKSGAPTDPLSG